MKRTFKKAISVLLSVLMLVSLCTIAITTASAEEITINDLGVSGGNFLLPDQKIANDPTDANVKVLHLYANDNRPNFELANPTNKSEAFQPVSGTVYTVMFDYYVEKCTSGSFNFTLYYGNEAVGGAGRSDSFVQSRSGFSPNFIGDGKWHTAAITFNAQDVKKSDVLLKKLYLTYYSTGIFDGYIKNLSIITETFANGFYDSFSTDMTYYYNSDGTANLNLINGSCASSMTSSYKDEDGRLVVVPTSNNNAGNATQGSVQYLTVLKSNDKSAPVILKNGATYKLKLKYKVIDVAGGTVHVGLGHGTGTGTSGWTATYVIKRNTHTAVTNGFTTLETTFTATKDATLRVYVSRKDSKIVIDSVELVAKFGDNDKVAEMTYNDNGNITKKMAYVGTDHTVFADNGYLGEKSQGWCTDTALTNVADKVSNDYTSLYAKYNTVVIDKMNFTSLVKNWDYAGTASLSNGTITTTSSSNMAIVIPAYDAPNTSGNGAGYDYYSFQNGQRYIVQVYLNSIKDAAGQTRSLDLMGATAAGSNGARDTGINAGAVPSWKTSSDGTALTNKISVYDFTRAAGSKGWETCAMGLRSGNDKANFTMEIDKIIITKMDGNENYAVAHTNHDNSYQFVKLGDSIVLPEVADKEDSIFVGWYNNVTTASSHNISTSDISIPAGAPYKLTKSGVYQFKANFLSKESVTVDFSEEKYGTLKNGTDLGGSSGQMTIVTDETIDEAGESTDNTYLRLYTNAQNIFKTSLYHDNGNRLYATNDVTYNFEIRYKVVTPDTSTRTDGYIGICRNPAGGYVPRALDGIGSNCTALASAKKVTENFVTISKNLKVTNLYYNDGDSPNLKAQLSVMICQGDIYVDYIKVTPVSYDPEYVVYDETKGDVTVDYENGIITAIPKEGYALSTKDIVVKMTYRDYVYDSSANKVTLSAKDADQKLNLNTTDCVNFSFNTNAYNNYNEKMGALRFYVDFVDATATDNADFLAVSYREAAAEGYDGKYQSAGIRFRARFSSATVENAEEIGFRIVPKKLLDSASVTTVGAYMANVEAGTITDRSAHGIAYNKTEGTNIVYSQVGDFFDYQAVLTGLTKADGSSDLTKLDMCIAAYIIDAEGNVDYIELGTAYSYETIASK